MRVGLFIPCYIDQLFPQVGWATVSVLQRFGVEVEFPADQTCCGQPMANTGCGEDAAPLAHRFVESFVDFDHIVGPSGSCVAMVRHHYGEYFSESSRYSKVQANTWELCEFLHDVLAVREIPGSFPHRVGLHQSCHGLRELHLGTPSELVRPANGKVQTLLSSIAGLELVTLERPDECCGFGGTFSVTEEDVSVMMGRDRLADHLGAGAEVLTSADMSCLMHLDGLSRRDRNSLQVMHVAELFANAMNDAKSD